MPIVKQFPLGPIQTNTYLLGCDVTKTAAIIDPAWDGDKLAQMAIDEGLTLTHILLTHTHFDHVGGLADLKEAVPDAPIYMHTDAGPFLAYATATASNWGLELRQPPDADIMLTPGEAITVGEITLDILYTPGHAPGHVSFYSKEHALIFSGDVLFQYSIGRTDLPGGDHARLIQSIEEELLVLPDETQVLSGHGPLTTVGFERENNPFLR